MNKQELIGKIEGLETEAKNTKFRKAFYSVKARCLDFVAQLDEPQTEKVEVPDFVAEWYESHKDDLEDAISDQIDHGHDIVLDTRKDFDVWFFDESDHPIETLIRMKDGYTVKPKRWVVKVVNEKYFVSLAYGSGIGSLAECSAKTKDDAYPFTDKSKAEAVATLVEGSVEEV